MRFLHEFCNPVNPNCKRYDNGWWQIDGDRLINPYGGHHSYNPSPDDEIIEANSWSDIIRLTIRDDSQMTGWVSPDGEFYGCKYSDHSDLAEYYIGKTERELETLGWVKIYYSSLTQKYSYACEDRLTNKQREIIEDKGIKLRPADRWEDNI